MDPAPAWYLDPDDRSRERYWNGSAFMLETRPALPQSTPFPAPNEVPAQPTQPRQTDVMRGLAAAMWVLAILTAIATIVACVALANHSAQSECDAFGCSGTAHPFRRAGFGVLAGGLLQAAVIAVLAQVCLAVSNLRNTAEVTQRDS